VVLHGTSWIKKEFNFIMYDLSHIAFCLPLLLFRMSQPISKTPASSANLFSHPGTILHLVILLSSIGFFIALSMRWLQRYEIIICSAAGLLIWTLGEYFINRFLLHGESRSLLVRLMNKYHSQHHTNPEDVRYSFIHPLIIFIAVIVLLALGFVTVGKRSVSLASGFLFGYWMFGLLHLLQHHYPAPTWRFLRMQWQNHFLHHHYYPRKAFGISMPLWDYVFGSLPRLHLFVDINAAKAKSSNRTMSMIEVGDKKSEALFINVPRALLQDDPNWIPGITAEIRSIFDPSANPYFKHGVARRWIVVDAYGEVLGRIAAFINFQKMYDGNKKTGCIGFFDCVDNREAAFLLFDTAIEWLVERYQVDAVDGPVNFGENDKYWGLLIKGFTPPSYGMNYNPAYYQNLFESYGFEIRYKQLTNRIDLGRPIPERFDKIAKRVLANRQHRFEPYRNNDRERFVRDFVTIYNQAWASFNNFQPMDADIVRKSLDEMGPIMDESAIWFVYVNDKAAGVLLAVPDVNEILKYSGDISSWWNKGKFLFYRRTKGFSCLRVILMGIVPEFQQRGLESGLIMHAYAAQHKNGRYQQVQLAWVGDFNHKMIAIHNAIGATEEKQHATFRKTLTHSEKLKRRMRAEV